MPFHKNTSSRAGKDQGASSELVSTTSLLQVWQRHVVKEIAPYRNMAEAHEVPTNTAHPVYWCWLARELGLAVHLYRNYAMVGGQFFEV